MLYKFENEEAKKKVEDMEAKGRELFKKYIPADIQALIVAYHVVDKSDIQSDYFHSREDKTVILGWSKHKRDLFSEMRKHAHKIPETAHLGVGCGHFEPRVIIKSEAFQSNGAYYHQGQYSPWHRELTEKDGHQAIFHTKAEAEKYIISKGQPHSITFEGREINFDWRIEEEKVEHREKYSMGAGYYLKDGFRHDTGWKIEKLQKWHDDWDKDIYVSLTERCIFEG